MAGLVQSCSRRPFTWAVVIICLLVAMTIVRVVRPQEKTPIEIQKVEMMDKRGESRFYPKNLLNREKKIQQRTKVIRTSLDSNTDKYQGTEKAKTPHTPDNSTLRIKYILKEKHPRWIVVTSINQPTSQVRAMNKLIGWKLVVVGDRKSPKDWNLPGAVFLDVEAQNVLGYRINKFLPYNSYSRKNIGFLYAIENGAEWIYETDDDNGGKLTSFWMSADPVDVLTPVGVTGDAGESRLFNPYPHFGQSTLWPRGYPLDHLRDTFSHQYRVCRIHCPAVQQGLADGDPDVDAVFRLTRRPAAPKGMRFDPSAPSVALPLGTMSPYNSQNTMHHKDAFFGLLLPITVTDRVTDIYRAYWAQRLLWLVSSSLVFHTASVWHERNVHSILKDAVQEEKMLRDSGRLVASLTSWRCEKRSLLECVTELTRHLVIEGFLQQPDVAVVEAWVADLVTVGYKAPALSQTSRCSATELSVEFRPKEQMTLAFDSSELAHSQSDLLYADLSSQHLSTICPGLSPAPTILPVHNILLVVSVGSDAFSVIPIAQLSYRAQFAHIIFCGSVDKKQLSVLLANWSASYVNFPEPDPVPCVDAAARIGYKVDGILHISSRVAIDYRSLPLKETDKLWMVDSGMTSSMCAHDPSACVTYSGDVIKELSSSLTVQQRISFDTPSDFTYRRDAPFYLPGRSTAMFTKLVRAAGQRQLAALALLAGLEKNGNVKWLLGGETKSEERLLVLNDVQRNNTMKRRLCQRLRPLESKL